MSSNVSIPKVSVRLMTYNHEPYIEQAIQSCIDQKTNFDFEIVIGDDFSTDGTLEICREYQRKYPEIITLLKREKEGDYHKKRRSLGRLYNFVDILNHCKGKYIALLDGDDYWLDNKKLQRQVDILESYDIYAFSFHNCLIKEKDRFLKKDLSFIDADFIIQEDLITKSTHNFVPTASIVLRSVCLPEVFPEWFYKQAMGDWALNLMLLNNNNKAHFIDEPFSVYRREGQGIWEKLSNIPLIVRKRNFIYNLKFADLNLNQASLDRLLTQYDKQLELFVEELERSDYRKMSTAQLLRHLQYRLSYSVKKLLKFKK